MSFAYSHLEAREGAAAASGWDEAACSDARARLEEFNQTWAKELAGKDYAS